MLVGHRIEATDAGLTEGVTAVQPPGKPVGEVVVGETDDAVDLMTTAFCFGIVWQATGDVQLHLVATFRVVVAVKHCQSKKTQQGRIVLVLTPITSEPQAVKKCAYAWD